jgi:hypothetical protein
MKDIYYFTAWTDSGCLLGCDHQHQTVASAVACSPSGSAGSYVIAVENQKLRELNEGEEIEFQRLKYGIEPTVVESVLPNLLIRVSMFIRIQTEPK